MRSLKYIKRTLALFVVVLAAFGCEFNELTDDTVAAPETARAQLAVDPSLPQSPPSLGGQLGPRQMRRPGPSGPAPRSATAPCEAEELITSAGPALVFNQPGALEGPLSLANALDALLVDAGNTPGTAEQAAIIQTMLDSFGFSAMVNSDALTNYGLTSVDVDVRNAEAAIDAAQFVIDMRPTAVFNRLDLAPADGSDCGEQRVIYSLEPGSPLTTVPFQDFTLIFEARYPNPTPADGLAGCQPIADFYAGLASPSLTDAQRAQALADFFLSGVSVTNSVTGQVVALPPVVTVANYQGLMGQIRTNQFIDFNWQLREFRTNIDGTNTLQLIPDTVKGNPISALYSAAAAANAGIPGTMRDDFVADLLDVQLPLLLQPELSGMTNTDDILVGFEPAIGNQFAQFTSNAQGLADDPMAVADQALRDEIDDRLVNTFGIAPSELTSEHVLNRLGAMSCGGCHQYSSNRPVSPNLDWPAMAFAFKHVDTDGSLSPALINTFLPKRRAFLLDTFLCQDAEPDCESDADCAEGLSCVEGECIDVNADPCEDVECPGDLICIDGDCVSDPDAGCETNADCPYGQICNYGECVEPVVQRCRSDRDCPRGLECERGICVEPSTPGNVCEQRHPVVTGPTSVRGDSSTGGSNQFSGTCGGIGPESLIEFQPEMSGAYCISTVSARFDTVLHVRESRCQASRAEIACNDDRRDRASLSQVQIRAQNDRSFFIFVDTNQRRGGAFALSITAGPCRTAAATDERTPDDTERVSDERSDEDGRTSDESTIDRPTAR